MITFITIGGLIGGWIGAAFDHGNWFGAWSLILSVVGSGAGWWACRVLDDYING